MNLKQNLNKMATLAFGASIAFAQNSPEVAQADEEILTLEAIVVEGQKIERSRLETVDSIRVFTAESLEERSRTQDLYQLFDQSANINRTGSFDFAIRGIAGTGPTNADSGARAIGVFVDGVTQTNRATQANAQSLWDTEQIEILRGPQSTTIGRNTLAGALVVRSKQPKPYWASDFQASYGEYNTYQVAAAVTGPITENLAFRIAAENFATDNFVNNALIDGDDFDREERIMGRGILTYSLKGGGEISFNYRRNEFDDYGDDYVLDEDPEARISDFNSPSTWFTEVDNYALTVEKPFLENWEFTSVTGYSESTFDRDSDADGDEGNSIIAQDTEQYEFSQELRINYNGEKVKMVAGLYYSEGELDDAFSTTGIDLRGIIGPIAPFPLPFEVDQASLEEYNNYAAFLNIDYKLTEKLTLIGGLRLDIEERSRMIDAAASRQFDLDPATNGLVDAVLGGLTGAGNNDGEQESTEWLPKVGFNYQLTDNLSAGFTYQQGYRPAGVSTNLVRGEAREFDAEFTSQYEASLRALILDDRLSITANVFFTDWTDQQVSVQGDLGPFDTFVENAGKSELYGFELETEYQASKELYLSAYIGHTTTEFKEFESAGQDLAGNRFGGAREWTLGAGAVYTNDAGFYANMFVNHLSDGFNDPDNAELNALDAYTLVNSKIGYRTDNWGVYLYGNNIFDELYIAESYRSENPDARSGVIVGDPRIVGVIAEVSF